MPKIGTSVRTVGGLVGAICPRCQYTQRPTAHLGTFGPTRPAR